MGEFFSGRAIADALDAHDQHVVLHGTRGDDLEAARAGFIRDARVIGDRHGIASERFQTHFATHAMRRAKNADENAGGGH
jgi:hypothetical protein